MLQSPFNPGHSAARSAFLLRISVVCALGWLAQILFMPAEAGSPYILFIPLKGLSVALLAVIAFRSLAAPQAQMAGGALAFSSLGDVLLALRGDGFFLFGLISFLIAHLFYIALFSRYLSRPLLLARGQKLLVTLILLYAAAMMWWLLPATGALAWPVTVYMLVLTAMVVTVLLAGFESRMPAAGALLFLLSDSLIGASRFRGAPGQLTAALLIWLTYYSAQYLLAVGLISETSRKRAGQPDDIGPAAMLVTDNLKPGP